MTEWNSYDSFYSRGGWKYDLAAQERHARQVLIPRAGWKPGERVTEIGAGMGHQADMLRRLGFDVLGVDRSEVGVAEARKRYPELQIVCADTATWSPPELGHVYARGHSWWHYELNGVNEHGVDVPAMTARCFEWIPRGGVFVLQIVTDFSGGRRKGSQIGVWNNKPEAYQRLFERFGEVSITDWAGKPVSARPEVGVIVVTRKIGG